MRVFALLAPLVGLSAAFQGTRATFGRSAVSVVSATAGLCETAETFITSQSGFYSPSAPEMLADDFVFRGPVIGPLNKRDYLSTMDTFKVHRAFPDISPNAFGFTVDPLDERRVWFFVRNTGTNSGPFGLGYFDAPPTGKTAVGPPEAFSIMFDENDRVKLLTVGYVVDRFQGNTGGLGAAFGLLKVANISLPPATSFLYRVAVALGNRLPGFSAKSCSPEQDLPEWWLKVSKERGPDGI